MRLLLDTHTLIWYADGATALSSTAAACLADPANTLCLSMASAWEIAIKVGLGKLVLSASYADFMSRTIVGYGISLLPITLEDCADYADLPFPIKEHRDPFDRLIIVHAKRHEATVLGADANFDVYGVQRVW